MTRIESTLQISSASISDRGLSEKRPQNEDSLLEMPQCGIFAVADGVGGAQAGEVASQMAMELLGEAFANLPSGSDAESVMRAAIGQANSAIYQMAHELPQLSNMATTIVALHLSGEIATIGHVGDSRLYRVDSGGNLFRETDDHSMVAEEVRAGRMTEEQAENHPSRNIISRALGAEPTVTPDLRTIMVDPGTAFLLCSDGITRHVTDAEIKGVLTFGGEPADVCDYLKRLCFERGAEDNLTAVVVRVSSIVRPLVKFQAEPLEDGEESTVATARVLPPEYIETDNDSLLELDTVESYSPKTLSPDAGILDESVLSPVDHSDQPSVMEVPAADEHPDPLISGSIESDTQNSTDERVPMFGGTSLDASEPDGSSSFGSILTGIAMLIIGGLIGMGVYHFVLVPKPAEPASPAFSEMKAANIPLSAFEENRRNVDKDPVGYIVRFGSDPQDSEDYYLLGRAYLLTADFIKARAALTESRNRLAEADPVNAKTLSADISVALAVTNDTTIQAMLKKELEAAAKPSANSNSSR